jgi:hypothetical protein
MTKPKMNTASDQNLQLVARSADTYLLIKFKQRSARVEYP